MILFRQYILVGGMPQAVIELLNTNDYYKVDRIEGDVLKLYKNDIAEYANDYEHKVLSIFDEIPSQLSKHEKKFMLSSLSKDARGLEITKMLLLGWMKLWLQIDASMHQIPILDYHIIEID